MNKQMMYTIRILLGGFLTFIGIRLLLYPVVRPGPGREACKGHIAIPSQIWGKYPRTYYTPFP